MSRQQISVFVQDLRGGGVERVTLNLIAEIAARGWPVDLVMVRRTGAYVDLVPESVRIVDLRRGKTLTALAALVRYLRRERPIALLSGLVHVNIVAIAAAYLSGHRTPVVISEHNTPRLTRAGGDASTRLGYLLAPIFYPRADHIVAVSKGVAEDMVEEIGLARDRIEVINNPVVTRQMLELAAGDFKHRWFRSGEMPVLLGVGRLTPQKDFENLINAFAIVRRSRLSRLLILGEGAAREELRSAADATGFGEDIELYGFAPNPYSAMRQASVFVLSSRWEGSPTVLIEAMACGTPVVATDCPSGPREILQDGKYGTLVPIENPLALAEAIEQALTTPRPSEELVARARSFSAETSAAEYLKLLAGDGMPRKPSGRKR